MVAASPHPHWPWQATEAHTAEVERLQTRVVEADEAHHAETRAIREKLHEAEEQLARLDQERQVG